MIKILQSEWTASALGAIMYFLIVALSYHPAPPVAAKPAVVEHKDIFALEASTPEFAQMIEEFKARKDGLDEKEARLNAFAAQLENERAEIVAVTQAVSQIQKRFNSNILIYHEAETANLKKLAKTYLTMGPQSAAQKFNTMDDDTIAKILRNMKETDSALFLDAIAKSSPTGEKRVVHITERMRVTISDTVWPTNQPPAIPSLNRATNVPAKTP